MNKLLILTLLNIPGFGRAKSKAVIESNNSKIENISDLYSSIIDANFTQPKIHVPLLRDVEHAYSLASNIIDKSKELNVEITSYLENKYSRSLLNISNFPLIIYSKGNLDLFDTPPKVAVVGTRRPSELGIKLGSRITEIFVQNNLVIVSGLALGCDTIAHQTCIAKGGKTISVLASGLDEIYPKSNLKLSKEIIDSGGLLISEYPIGVLPRNNYFVERNRIQSGISNGVCVIETEIKGGTMRTVEFAEKQKRIIGCVFTKDLINNEIYNKGNQLLIKENRAYSLSNAEEIGKFISEINHFKYF
jgi:DNA processing protein